MVLVAIKLSAAVALSFAVSASAIEGADYIIESCDTVLNNKQDILPVPFEMAKDRDTGYPGENPIMDNSTTVVKRASLGTVRDQSGLEPTISIGAVYMKDSDQSAEPPASYRMGGSIGGFDYCHLNGVVSPSSELTAWQWQRSKWFGLKKWLTFYKDRAPTRMVLVHSTGDTLYGGCDENTISAKYDQIIGASPGSPKIVVGGEVSPYPSDLGAKYASGTAEASRLAILNAFSLGTNWAAAYANCTGELNSICDSTPTYKYANSNFIMGPAEDVYAMLEELTTYTSLANRKVTEYFFEHPDLVTIDYGGILSLSMHNMVKSTGIPVEIGNGQAGKQLINKATGLAVCFVNGNGNSFDALKTLAADFKAQQIAAMAR